MLLCYCEVIMTLFNVSSCICIATVQWNLFVTTASKIKSITCDDFSVAAGARCSRRLWWFGRHRDSFRLLSACLETVYRYTVIYCSLYPCSAHLVWGEDMFAKYNLRIGCLNIGGNAKMKCTHNDIVKLIGNHDIFTILESWLDPDDACPSVPGYINFRSERKRNCKAKRSSGGIIIYCRKSIIKGVTKLKNTSQDMVWLKLDRAYFGLPQSIYLCVAYLAPDSSSYAKNAENFKEFKNGIDHYASLGHLAVIGDLNARVGTRQETVMSVNEQGINSTHGLVNKLELSKRNSEDNTVNARGQKLFDLATNYELFLANGRSCGDLTGKYTCCQWNGQSVVDVFMAQSDVLSRINYFQNRQIWLV